MRRSISKAIIAGVTALAMSTAVLSTAAPASAAGFHGGFGGFHGSMGGFRPAFGGFHSGFGGFHPGFRPGFAGFHHGFHPFFANRRFFFHRRFHNHVFVSTAVVAGPWWWGGYGGADGCWTYRPVYDASGAYLGYSYVNVCW